MTDVIQRAFNVGEVSEDYWNRNDLEWFNRSVRLCKNFIPTSSGPLVNRQGLKFISEIDFKPQFFEVLYSDENTVNYISGGSIGIQFKLVYFQKQAYNGTISNINSGSFVNSYNFRDFCPVNLNDKTKNSGVLVLSGGIDPKRVIYNDGSTFTISNLSRLGDNLIPPSPVTVVIPGAATIPVYYQVSTVTDKGVESLPSTIASDTGDALTAANQAQVSWTEPAYGGFTVTKYYIYRVETKISRFVGDLPATSTGSAKTFVDFKFDRDVNLGPINTIYDPNIAFENYRPADGFCVHQQRLIGIDGNSYFASRVGAAQSLYYGNPILDTDAFLTTLIGTNGLIWTRSVEGNLMFADTKGLLVAKGNEAGVLTPSASGVTRRWSQEVKSTRPLLFKSNIGFYSNNYDFIALFKNPNGADSFQSKNLSDLSNKFSINETVYHTGYSSGQQELIWITSETSVSSRSSRSITLNEEQGVYAWAQHETDGKILCVNGDIFLVQRTINGSTKYYIEQLLPRQDNRVSGVFLDSYKTYTSPSVNITGLGHLEAKQVYAVVDGLKQGPYTVSGGAITLTSTGTTVHIGLPYESVVTTHDLDLVGNQTLVRQPKTTSAANVYFKNTANGQVRVNADPWQEIRIRDEGDAYGPIQLQSGLTEDIHMSTSPRREQTISVRQNEPFPMTITAIARSVRT